MRSTADVFESHLKFRKVGKTEDDIKENFSSDIVIISKKKKFVGHDGVRESAKILQELIGEDAEYSYDRVETAGEMAYLVWSASSKDKAVCHGVDSFHIKDGKVLVQTIYYDVDDK